MSIVYIIKGESFMDRQAKKRKSKMPFFIILVIAIFVIVAAALIIYVTSEPKEETQALMTHLATVLPIYVN